jgi:hypothetical protein
MYKRAMAATARLRSIKENHEELTGSVVRTMVMGGSAFTLGVAKGAGFKEDPILHMPIELGVGIAAHALRFLGFGGKYSQHLADIGDGGIASYLHVLGAGIGAQHWGGGGGAKGTVSGDLADRLSAIANQ